MPGRETVRARVRVTGIVQGVGFRPHVHRLAVELQLTGFVGNDADGVFIEAEGQPAAIAALLTALREKPPPLARIEAITAVDLPARGEPDFAIVPSARGGARSTLISPDVATCADCLAELFDPVDRRYRYPFTNCTNCGPRYTIVTDVPYDRPFTTMAGFPLCADCAREYDDPADRRYHAQPVCCPACGPQLALLDSAAMPLPGDPLARAVELLAAGAVLAVKGLGGYHLAADAGNQAAVAALRGRKHRADKPFAVLCADVTEVERLVVLDEAAAGELASPARPIVLLPRRPEAAVADAVAPGNRLLGILLAYTPLHHLLVRSLGRPLVLTSGNASDEPIAYRDAQAPGQLAGIADGYLTHNRPIQTRTDDSVLAMFRGRPLPLRRSRGFVPAPITLPVPLSRPALAVGAELKNTIAVGRGSHAFVSQHIGDLENLETLQSFHGAIDHLQRLFDITPQLLVHDLHPEYLSTKYARDRHDIELLAVQHHHAHIASCLADNGETGPVVGVAFDGLGYGADGTLWGGELLIADLAGYRRVGHLQPTRLPGGSSAIREPWRMAVSWLTTACPGPLPAELLARHPQARAVARLAGSELAPVTTSAGRLFDAVAALCGVRDRISYEGQAAIELEQLADPGVADGYPVQVVAGPPIIVAAGDLIAAVQADLLAGRAPALVAARFHHGLATATAGAAALAARSSGLDTVALSGGVFANQLLLAGLVDRLTAAGLRVLTHHVVPPGDGGISLGQLAIAAGRGPRSQAPRAETPVDPP